MAIAKLKPTAEIPIQPAPIDVEKTGYKGIVIDTSETPIESTVAYLDGMPWTVNYYRQLIGEHNDIRDLDPGQNAAFQQYEKINLLELRVSSGLQTSYDSTTGITTVTGSSTIIHVIPNINDYFVSDAGRGQEGLFRVRSVERKTFNRQSVYMIDYVLVGYVNDNSVLFADIETKTVRQYFFSKERLTEGLSPVLREEDYTSAVNISKYYLSTIQRYFATFFNRATMTLVVPEQDGFVYDPMQVAFLIAIMDSNDAREIRDMKIVSMDHDRYVNQGTLWSALLERNYGDIKRVHQKVIIAPRTYFNHSSLLKGAYYWAAGFVYPWVTEDKTALAAINTEAYAYDDKRLLGLPAMETPPFSTTNVYTDSEATLPLIKSINIDDFYVLSEAFYSNTGSLSVLEILVKDYLKAQSINLSMLGALLKAYSDWPVLEQYYYGPLLMLLMKDAIKGFYQ